MYFWNSHKGYNILNLKIMKKLLLIIFALACFTISKANPILIPPPAVGLSELTFDSNGNWIIKLEYKKNHSNFSVESIFISTSTERCKLKNIKLESSYDQKSEMMVCNDSLSSNLNINPEGDSIQIEYHYSIGYLPDFVTVLAEPVIFGKFRNAKLKAPKTGESIAAYSVFSKIDEWNLSPVYENIFSIDKSPSLGNNNDSTGMCGTLKGKIYDENNQVVTNSSRSYYTKGINGIKPSANGSYSVRVFSYKNSISQISYQDGFSFFTVEINPIEIDAKPDSVIIADIHFKNKSSIKKIKSNPISVLNIFPNPIKDVAFNYEISIPVKSSASYIELISLSGQKIVQFPITENVGKINLPANTTNGIYTLRLLVNNKNYGTSKIIIAGK